MPALRKKLATPGSAAALLLVALLAAYAADVGHGFIKDDFRWIRETRLEAASDAPRLLFRTDGFYRPLVSFTFALNSATSGTEPRAYGLTNLALMLLDAALVFLFARRLELEAAPALVAAGTWAFNFHGINMAVLWISGRTALMVTLGALLTAIALRSGRSLLAGCCCLLALLSKEEAVMLPIMFAAWIACDTNGPASTRHATAARRTWPCFAALAVYIVLRLQTDAFWPANAPSYYRLSSSPSVVAQNILQYADRSLTWPAVAAVVALAASAGHVRFSHVERRAIIFGTIWLACTFALTIFVPVRSSLYAVLPSVGASLAAGAVASAAAHARPRPVGIAMVALTMLPFLLLPIYWSRNERWVRLADLTSTVLEQVRTESTREPGRRIVLIDNPAERYNLEAAFGNLWPDAAALCLPEGAKVDIARQPCAGASVLRLDRGHLTRTF